jgi:hypothetical protein
LRQQLPAQEVPVRNRLGMAAAAASLAAVLSVTLASASSPGGGESHPDAAPPPTPTVAPIQQLTFALHGTGSARGDQEATASAAQVGAKVGQVPGFCHLHS